MKALTLLPRVSLLVASALLGGCLLDDTIDPNRAPTANAGEDQQLDFDGDPVTVRLDGRESSDPDGTIQTYRWRSADLPGDAGPDAGPIAPPNPRDEARPELELSQGTFRFALWVVDDDGAVSKPDYVTVNVGSDPVQECVEDSLPLVPEPCLACACGVSEECRTAVVACREDCWGLIQCIGASCPDTSDTNCIVMNCGSFLAGATQAMATGPCVTMCIDSCRGGS
jgi:hypothetical protein